MKRRPALLHGLLAGTTILAMLVAALAPVDDGAAKRDHRQAGAARDRDGGAKQERNGGKRDRKGNAKQDQNKGNTRDKKASSEVVGGQVVPDGAYPFVTALVALNGSGEAQRQFCGGSLIAPSYVLTAAHCVAGAKPERFAVIVGITAFGSEQGEFRTVAGYQIHPSYHGKTIGNDVAILTLQEPVTNITPVQLIGNGDGSLDWEGTALTLVGWGDMKRYPHFGSKGKYPLRMQQRQISVIGEGTCKKQWHRVGFKKAVTTNATLCTTAGKFGAGDSGSPLFVNANGAYVQISLVSGGFAGDRKRKVSDFGPRLSAAALAEFIDSVAGT